MEEGSAVEGHYKGVVWTKAEGKERGVDSRQGMAETDEQTWSWHTQVPGRRI